MLKIDIILQLQEELNYLKELVAADPTDDYARYQLHMVEQELEAQAKE